MGEAVVVKRRKTAKGKMVALDQIDFFANNFDFLRFLAASLVIFGHSFPLYGLGLQASSVAFTLSHVPFGSLALSTFFFISGFLVTKSWLDSPQIIKYFKKRILRIFPALVCTTLLAIFVVGPMVTTLSSREYFSNPLTWDYLRNIFMQTWSDLPGVFQGNPLYSAVNGSLWTLPIEFWLYIFVALLGALGIFSKRKIILPVIILLVIFLNWRIFAQSEFQSASFLCISAFQFFRLAIFFAAGSLCYVYRRHVILDYRVALFALAALAISYGTSNFDLILLLTLPYLILSFAYLVDTPILRNFGKYGDFSYGMYVYAFPVQQTVTHFLRAKISLPEYFLISYFVTLVIAGLSWHLVEKQALKLKKKSIFSPIFRKTATAFKTAFSRSSS